jgi:hypothetical protein
LKNSIQEKLLEEYKDYLHFKASSYSKKGFEYDEIFNQGYLFSLENYPKYSSSIELRKKVDSCLRNYYNQEKRKGYISYGINPEDINI